MSELKAVIFDMDGVLIDSEQRNMRLWREINEEFGNVLDLSILPYMMGGSPEENYARFKDRLPDPETYDRMKAERKKRGEVLIEKEGMPLKAGVLEMLQTLQHNANQNYRRNKVGRICHRLHEFLKPVISYNM